MAKKDYMPVCADYHHRRVRKNIDEMFDGLHTLVDLIGMGTERVTPPGSAGKDYAARANHQAADDFRSAQDTLEYQGQLLARLNKHLGALASDVEQEKLEGWGDSLRRVRFFDYLRDAISNIKQERRLKANGG